MKKMISVLVVLLATQPFCISQVKYNLAEQPGIFEILERTDYTTPECGLTKAEVALNLEKIREIIAAVRQNPVLSDIKGYNGRARIYNMSMTCKGKNWYGVPSRISFEFSSFFINKSGKVAFNTIEPPEWSLYINDIFPMTFDIFNMRDNYFTVPLKKVTLQPGVDVYDGELWVLYDPSRPDYWIPVTVEEAFASVREDMKNMKDEIELKYFREFYDKEYNEIPAGQRKGRAYFGGNLTRVSPTSGYEGQDSLFPYIMKVNPEYWNKELSRSAVQFIWFRSCQTQQCKDNNRRDIEAYLKNPDRGSGCDLDRFELSFGIPDIKNISRMVGK